jgi:plastocyanin
MSRFGRFALAGALAALAACSGGNATDYNGNPGNNSGNPPMLPGGTPVANASVSVADDLYSPNSVLLAAGGTVTWNWTGNNGHSVTSGSFTPNAPVSYPPTTLQVTFAITGDYQYFCTVHGASGYGTTGMIGTVFVR